MTQAGQGTRAAAGNVEVPHLVGWMGLCEIERNRPNPRWGDPTESIWFAMTGVSFMASYHLAALSTGRHFSSAARALMWFDRMSAAARLASRSS